MAGGGATLGSIKAWLGIETQQFQSGLAQADTHLTRFNSSVQAKGKMAAANLDQVNSATGRVVQGMAVMAQGGQISAEMLVGTLGAGVFWYDARGQATCLSTNEGLSDNFILSLQVDRERNLWIGTDGGLSKLTNGTITSYTTKQGLSNDTVYSIHEDRDRNLVDAVCGLELER